MPSTIPFIHPSLVLGNIADTGVLNICNQILEANSKIDSAQDTLNSLIMMKRSLSMTLNEIAEMGLDTDELTNNLKSVDDEIKQAAQNYITQRIENEKSIQEKRVALAAIQSSKQIESPIDLSQSKLIDLPLSSDSIKFDSQYFSFGNNMQDDAFANIEKFVKQATSDTDKSNSIAKSASDAVQSQFKNHSIAGTLIITASCTYSNVKIFNPVILDADKSVAAWNEIYSDDTINSNNFSNDSKPSVANNNGKSNNTIPVITGASYGASFVGMVHILKSETSNSGDVESMKNDLEQKLKIGGWLENAIGGYGVDASSLKEVKAMLDTKKVSSHITIIATGGIPSIASSKLTQNIEKLSSAEIKIPVDTSSDNPTHESTASEAEKAREFAKVISIQKARTQNIMNNLSKIDYEANQSFDINSLIDAFDNFVSNKNTSRGVPVSFYIKNLTKNEIEMLWINKYYPVNNPQPNTTKQ